VGDDAEGMRSFNARCASGIEPDAKRIKEHLDNSLLVVDRAQTAYRLREGRADFAPRLPRGLSLKDAALKLGFLTAEQFDKWVRPADMTHPLAS
jgi:fumarate hydratase class II